MMNRKLKKTLSLIAGFAAGFFFAGGVCFDATLLIDFMNGELSFGAACFILAISILINFGCMLLIIYFNRVFDEGEGIVQKTTFKGRWPMNVLFVSLVLVVFYSVTYINDRQADSLLRNQRQASPLILFIAVMIAAVVYIRNYHRLIPRNRQVKAAEKIYSLNQRRFTFIAEEFLAEGGIRGTVQGEIRSGDRAFAHSGSQDSVKVRIGRIYTDGMKVSRAKDQKATIYLNTLGNASFTWHDFVVVSNTVTGHTVHKRIDAENPRISGMLSVYSEYVEDSRFMSTFIFDCVHGHYLVPAKTEDQSALSGDITEAMSGSHNVLFQSVSSSREPDKSVFPVFTDWDALSRYENIMDDEKTLVLIMDFPQATEMLGKGYEGIVINPFGPSSLYLSREYIASIKSLEGYRKEFILKEDSE